MLDKIKSPFDPQVEYRNYYQRIIDIINRYKRDLQAQSGWALTDFKDKLKREVEYKYISQYEIIHSENKLKVCWLNKEWTDFNIP